jgi:thymidylate synthase (FAD)
MVIYNMKEGTSKIDLLSYTKNGDLLVVNAARCSFDKEHTVFDEEKDSRLLTYLAREGHVLPFRHPSATLRIYAPLFLIRQIGKHQVGFSWSEVSRRYVSTEPEFFFPEILREASKDKKQGSKDTPVNQHLWTLHDMKDCVQSSLATYNHLLEKGVAPEQARMVLPQNMFTTVVVTGTLLGWHHMFKLRTEEHTQKETQDLVYEIGDKMRKIFPHSWRALNKE